MLRTTAKLAVWALDKAEEVTNARKFVDKVAGMHHGSKLDKKNAWVTKVMMEASWQVPYSTKVKSLCSVSCCIEAHIVFCAGWA
jgi:hypothetical protein